MAVGFKEEGADLVIAITHMKWEMIHGLQKAQGVNFILGGHGHDYRIRKVNET